jgi:hypothetical protein
MLVLLDDDRGCMTLQRIRPWHRILARSQAARLDRELAGGASPEASAALAARAIQLTSMEYRRGLAASLVRVLVAAGESASSRSQPVTGPASLAVTRPPRVPLCLERISESASGLADLAGHLVQPGPVPVRGVAMLSQLVTDGAGPLYREARRDDLGAIVERAARTLGL